MCLSNFSDFSITVQSLGRLNRGINCLLTWMADEGLLRENHRTVHFWDIIVGTFLCDINIHIYKICMCEIIIPGIFKCKK